MRACIPWKARTVPGFPPFTTLPLFFSPTSTKHTLKLQGFPCSVSRAFPTCSPRLSPLLFLLPIFYPLFGSTSSFLHCTLQLYTFGDTCTVPKAAFPSVIPVGTTSSSINTKQSALSHGENTQVWHSTPSFLRAVFPHQPLQPEELCLLLYSHGKRRSFSPCVNHQSPREAATR